MSVAIFQEKGRLRVLYIGLLASNYFKPLLSYVAKHYIRLILLQKQIIFFYVSFLGSVTLQCSGPVPFHCDLELHQSVHQLCQELSAVHSQHFYPTGLAEKDNSVSSITWDMVNCTYRSYTQNTSMESILVISNFTWIAIY